VDVELFLAIHRFTFSNDIPGYEQLLVAFEAIQDPAINRRRSVRRL